MSSLSDDILRCFSFLAEETNGTGSSGEHNVEVMLCGDCSSRGSCDKENPTQVDGYTGFTVYSCDCAAGYGGTV